MTKNKKGINRNETESLKQLLSGSWNNVVEKNKGTIKIWIYTLRSFQKKKKKRQNSTEACLNVAKDFHWGNCPWYTRDEVGMQAKNGGQRWRQNGQTHWSIETDRKERMPMKLSSQFSCVPIIFPFVRRKIKILGWWWSSMVVRKRERDK